MGREGQEANSTKTKDTQGPKPERARHNAGAEGGKKKEKKANTPTKNGQPQPGGGKAKQEDKAATGEVRRTKMRPGGRPA